MYYLAKLCRICVKSSQKLTDIDALDYDSVSFSDKLQVCTKMVFSPQKEVSKEICASCIFKLRISYEFYAMCKKSTKVLQEYVSKLLGDYNVRRNGTAPFDSSDICVALSPNIFRKRRQGKYERLAAMRKLYENQNIFRNGDVDGNCPAKPRGGLKDLLSFTKSYDFGFPLSCETPEASHLDKLIEFSNSFFYEDFEQYRNSILNIIQSNDDSEEGSDIEEMFKDVEENSMDTIDCVKGELSTKAELSIKAELSMKAELSIIEERESIGSKVDYVKVKHEFGIEDDTNIENRFALNERDGYEVINYRGRNEGSCNETSFLKSAEGVLKNIKASELQANEIGLLKNNETGSIRRDDTNSLNMGDKCSLRNNETNMLKSDGSSVLKNDESSVLKSDESLVLKSDESRVLKSKESRVLKNDESRIIKSDESRVLKSDASRVLKSDASRILKSDESRILKSDKPAILKSNEQLKYDEASVLKSNETSPRNGDKSRLNPNEITTEPNSQFNNSHVLTHEEFHTKAITKLMELASESSVKSKLNVKKFKKDVKAAEDPKEGGESYKEDLNDSIDICKAIKIEPNNNYKDDTNCDDISKDDTYYKTNNDKNCIIKADGDNCNDGNCQPGTYVRDGTNDNCADSSSDDASINDIKDASLKNASLRDTSLNDTSLNLASCNDTSNDDDTSNCDDDNDTAYDPSQFLEVCYDENTKQEEETDSHFEQTDSEVASPIQNLIKCINNNEIKLINKTANVLNNNYTSILLKHLSSSDNISYLNTSSNISSLNTLSSYKISSSNNPASHVSSLTNPISHNTPSKVTASHTIPSNTPSLHNMLSLSIPTSRNSSSLNTQVCDSDNQPISQGTSPKTSKIENQTRTSLGQPYICPKLRSQYLFRQFSCDICHRSFKTHGYMKAHKSKVHQK